MQAQQFFVDHSFKVQKQIMGIDQFQNVSKKKESKLRNTNRHNRRTFSHEMNKSRMKREVDGLHQFFFQSLQFNSNNKWLL